MGISDNIGSTQSAGSRAQFLNNAVEKDLYRSISGPDLVAAMYMPGLGLRIFGELATISYQTYRELAPVPTCGHVNVRGIARGPRWVAGSMVFIYFDRHALLDILDYNMSNNADATVARYQQLLQDREWIQLIQKGNAVEQALNQLDNNMDIAGVYDKRTGLVSRVGATSEDEAIRAYQELSKMDVALTAGMGDVQALAQTFEDPAKEIVKIDKLIDNLEATYKQQLAAMRADSSIGDNESWKKFKHMMVPDALPPFHVLLFGMSEAGIAVRAGIYNIHIQTDGATMSVEDLVTEGVCQYMATAVDPLDAIEAPQPSQMRVGVEFIRDRVETLQSELTSRLAYINFMKNTIIPRAEDWKNKRMWLQFKGYFNVIIMDDELGDPTLYIEFDSQTQYNVPPIDQRMGGAMDDYRIMISGGELMPEGFPGTGVVSAGTNVAGETVGIITMAIVADPLVEDAKGQYLPSTYPGESYLSIPMSAVMAQAIVPSSGRIQGDKTFRVSVMCRAKIEEQSTSMVYSMPVSVVRRIMEDPA